MSKILNKSEENLNKAKEKNKQIQLHEEGAIELVSSKEIEEKEENPTYVYALGGLGEVGKNMYILEQGNEIWIIDAGIKFSSEIFSIEGIIPSFEHLEKNARKIRGLIITHGHEDHIGAVPHLLNVIDIPKIYSGRMSSNQIWAKVKENKGVKKPKIEIINNLSKIQTKNFTFEFFNVNHSIPDSYGIIARTSNGIIVSTGDFKFDLSPVGSRADFMKMAKIGQEGVTLLLSDSTNAQVDKWSLSEKIVSQRLEEIISKSKNRIIIATFASNVYRVREAINIAAKYNRKIVIFGWSMEKTIKIARNIKYINADDNLFIQPKEMKNYNDEEILILSTGTQGEQMAALSKMANKVHPDIKIKASDTIVFASNPIPGNYEAVDKIMNNLIKMKANVITSKTHPGIHASGHAGRQEQLLMLNLIRPKFFFPVHGETMMLQEHTKLAEMIGIKKRNSFILKNGERLKVVDEIVSKSGSVVARDIFIDGTNLRGQSLKVVTDRKQMSENGFLSVTIAIDSKKNEIIDVPFVNIKGMFEEKMNIKVTKEIEKLVEEELEKYFKHSKKITFSGIKDLVKVTCENRIYKINKLTPIVAPIILNISSQINDEELNALNEITLANEKLIEAENLQRSNKANKKKNETIKLEKNTNNKSNNQNKNNFKGNLKKPKNKKANLEKEEI